MSTGALTTKLARSRQKMPPPAVAVLLKTCCEGTTLEASGAPWARLSLTVEARTVKAPMLLMPPPWPEPKLVAPSPPGAPMAELPLIVQFVTVKLAPTLLELLMAPPPALAPG